MAGGGAQERAQHVVGELRAGRDIKRRVVFVGSQRGDGGCRRGGVGVIITGSGSSADETDQFVLGQAAVGIEGDDQGAVLLLFAREEGRAGERIGMMLREDGEDVVDRHGNTVDLVAVKIIQHGIAVAVDDHHAGHRAVGIRRIDAGEIVHLTGDQADRLLRAGHSRAREGDTMHPCAGIAVAQGARAAGIDGAVKVEGIVVCRGLRGQRKTCACAPGDERRKAGYGMFGMGGGIVGVAGHVDGHGAHAADSLDHAAGIEAVDGFNIRIRLRRAIAAVGAGGSIDGYKLPIAGNGIFAKGHAGHEQHQTQGEDAQDGFHEGCSFPCAQLSMRNSRRKMITFYL